MLFILRPNTKGGKPLGAARRRVGEEAPSRSDTEDPRPSATDLLRSLVPPTSSSLPVSPLKLCDYSVS